jgi:hypothetical protein
MKEDFLHYLWQFKKFDASNLKSTNGDVIYIENLGTLNTNAGPDFFNAKLQIAEQVWAGNVEIHLKSSDWYVHHHELDKAYDAVILHVVWEHDVEVFRKNNSQIPTLELKNYAFSESLVAYKHLFLKTHMWINCENDIHKINDFLISNWLEKLFIERLEQKAAYINTLLESFQNDWEAVFFKLLAKNFGLKVNGDAFLQMANQTPFSIIRKQQNSLKQLEALFFGQSNLLNEDFQEAYPLELQENYKFLTQKFQLQKSTVLLHFFRLRPNNFPTIRLSQLAVLYSLHSALFTKLMEAEEIKEIYKILKVETSPFWKTHFTFGKSSKESRKTLTTSFMDLIIINTIIPMKFAYLKSKGVYDFESIFSIVKQIKPEKNTIIDKFKLLQVSVNSAFETQALLQLKNNYCDKNKCLQCAIGNNILQQK